MSTQSRRRLFKDFDRIKKENRTDIFAVPQENNFMRWEAIIIGPDDTIWENALLKLVLEFTEDYPSKPPNVRFLTEMFHPNSNNK